MQATLTKERRAPKAGYSTDAKDQYRQAVWSHLEHAVELIEGPNDRILIMPSHEGIEIDVALAHGVQAEHILCVDRSAAVIATSPWRKKHPQIDFMACDVAEAPARAAKRGWRIVAANLDLCGNFSEAMVQTVKGFWAGVRDQAKFVMGLTVAKGREGSAISYLLNSQGAGEFGDPKVSAMLEAAGVIKSETVRPIGHGTYTSGRVPMAWCVVDYENDEAIRSRKYRLSEEFWMCARRSDIEEGKRIAKLLDPSDIHGTESVLFYDMVKEDFVPLEERDFVFAYEVLVRPTYRCTFTEAAWFRLCDDASGDRIYGAISKAKLDAYYQSWVLGSMSRIYHIPEDGHVASFSCSSMNSAHSFSKADIARIVGRLEPRFQLAWRDFMRKERAAGRYVDGE